MGSKLYLVSKLTPMLHACFEGVIISSSKLIQSWEADKEIYTFHGTSGNTSLSTADVIQEFHWEEVKYVVKKKCAHHWPLRYTPYVSLAVKENSENL